MKKFIIKILIFILPIFVFIIFTGFLADGYTDPFYIRFTTPKQKSLIIGTSRAAQGLQPNIFNSILKNCSIYNYAFTIAHSPFGPVYFNSIRKKIRKEKGGIFIITVDPWSLSSWCKAPNDTSLFRENKLCLANTHIINLYPNYEYLFKNIHGNYIDLFFSKPTSMYLHKNGWLEIKNIAMDSSTVKKRINNKIKYYRKKHLPITQLSKIRLNYLMKTIFLLKEYGKVFLVRLPIHPKMMDIENEITQNFDTVILKAIKNSDGYLDMTNLNDKFQYTDGNHLYKASGKEVSVIIAKWIKNIKKVKMNNKTYRTGLN